jgi:hypothetical protein
MPSLRPDCYARGALDHYIPLTLRRREANMKSEEGPDMNTDFPHVPWVPRDHDANRQRIPPEVIDRFRGMQVACSWDGSQILAGAPTWEELFRQLDEAGVDTSLVVFGYIEDL